MTMQHQTQSTQDQDKTAKKTLLSLPVNKITYTLLTSALLSLGVTSVQAADSTASEAQVNTIDNSTADVRTPLSARQSTNGMIALVNDTPILKSDLASAMLTAQARIQASGQPAPSAQQLQNEVLNNLILRQLQLDLAKRAGIRPEPDAVNQRLAQIAQSQGYSSLAQFQQELDAEQPGSYAKLRSRIIQEESIAILQRSQIANRVNITEQDIDAFLASPEAKRLQKTEYHTIHIRVPFSDDFSRVTDSEKAQAMRIAEQAQRLLQNSDDAQGVLDELTRGAAQGYVTPVQGGDMGFHEAAGLPTDIANSIVSLESGDVIEPKITPEGIDVVKLVDKRGSENMIIPQWHVRHILVKVDEYTNNELAQQKINDLYEQLRRGKNFANLASTYSDDPGSAGRGGDLDWVSEGQMVPEFEKVMMNTQSGDFSTPFRSQFGWHILKVDETRQQDVSEQVKRNLAREALFQRLAPQAQEDWLQELRSNAYIQIFD